LVIPPDEDIFNDLKEIAINQIVQKEKDTLKILSSFKKKEETNSNLLKKSIEYKEFYNVTILFFID